MPSLLRPVALAFVVAVAPFHLAAQTSSFDEEVRRLAQHPAVKRAMELIEQGDALCAFPEL
ncbi:MAG TPA: hypothetical protein VLH75_11930 [Longimicrobiales bacterium]|nr:hypothetical protein [Longimicrobiales bacterium]